MIRRPIVAGQFYESDKDRLRNTIELCFVNEEFGPSNLPDKKGEAIGVISPHAGYIYSGMGAAWSFSKIKRADLYIMLGLSHHGYGTCVSSADWQTPFGLVESDNRFVNLLTKNGKLKINDLYHAHEHSIEVQLPFLKYIEKQPKICAIICSDDVDYRIIAEEIFNAVKTSKLDVSVIISSDFTHYGEHYGFKPFKNNVKERIYDFDAKAISFITSLDSREFLKYVEENNATICGYYPIAVGIELCKRLGALKGELYKYYTSGDISKDYSLAVGYASIGFVKD